MDWLVFLLFDLQFLALVHLILLLNRLQVSAPLLSFFLVSAGASQQFGLGGVSLFLGDSLVGQVVFASQVVWDVRGLVFHQLVGNNFLAEGVVDLVEDLLLVLDLVLDASVAF